MGIKVATLNPTLPTIRPFAPRADRLVREPTGGPADGRTQARSGAGQPFAKPALSSAEEPARAIVRGGSGQAHHVPTEHPTSDRVCPDCAGPIVRSSGCISCTHAGVGGAVDGSGGSG